MPPLLEQMARDALIARLERAERALAANNQAIASLTQALWHHIERRHDVKVGTDEGVDAGHLRAARRTVIRAAGGTRSKRKDPER